MYPRPDDTWVALSVRDDTDWAHLADVMNCPELCGDPRFASAHHRELAHDEFDALVADWTRTRTAAEIVETLGDGAFRSS